MLAIPLPCRESINALLHLCPRLLSSPCLQSQRRIVLFDCRYIVTNGTDPIRDSGCFDFVVNDRTWYCNTVPVGCIGHIVVPDEGFPSRFFDPAEIDWRDRCSISSSWIYGQYLIGTNRTKPRSLTVDSRTCIIGRRFQPR